MQNCPYFSIFTENSSLQWEDFDIRTLSCFSCFSYYSCFTDTYNGKTAEKPHVMYRNFKVSHCILCGKMKGSIAHSFLFSLFGNKSWLFILSFPFCNISLYIEFFSVYTVHQLEQPTALVSTFTELIHWIDIPRTSTWQSYLKSDE